MEPMGKDEKKPYSVVTLENIAGGALAEQFEAAWDELIANIRDPNTDGEEAREINIKIKISPDTKREKFMTTVRLTKKVAGLRPAADTLYLGRDENGKVRPFTYEIKQPDMFEEEKPDIAPIASVTQTAGGR